MNIEYNGRPLSAILPVPKTPSPDGKLPQLWIYGALWDPLTLPMSLENVDKLIAESWVQTSVSIAALESQLYQTARLVIDEEQQKLQTWYKPDPDGRDPLPVALAFSIENNPVPQNIPMLNPFPVPQFGEWAFVEEKDEAIVSYHIMNLPLEARQRWVMLGDMLKNLSSPLLWPAFTERHKLASQEQEYQNAMHSIKMQGKLAIEPAKTELLLKGGMLQAAHIHIEELHKMLKKPDLLEQWHAVQKTVRDLAQNYYDYHQQLTRTTTPVEETPAEPTPAAEQKKAPRRRQAHKTPTAIVARDKQAVPIKSDALNREIINGLRDKNAYTTYPEQGIAEYTRQFQKEKGQIIITIKPLEGEGMETILSALNTLGDTCIITYIAIIAIAIEHNGTDHIRTPFLVSPDDILSVCGKQKSHGSYTPFQRAEVIKHLKTLSQAHIIATMPGPGRRRGTKTEPTTLRAEGAIIDLLSFKIGEYSTITGEELWEKRSIAIGQWASMIPELNSQTATMLRRVLAYSAKNERYQLRLSVHLTLMFRYNARKGGVHICSMKALLEGAGIIPDTHRPGEFRAAIEKALMQIHDDKVIGAYARIVDASVPDQEREKLIREQARGWLDIYLTQQWRFSPPDDTREQYQKLLKEPTERKG